MQFGLLDCMKGTIFFLWKKLRTPISKSVGYREVYKAHVSNTLQEKPTLRLKAWTLLSQTCFILVYPLLENV